MDRQEKQFMEGMWNKVREKEENAQLAKALLQEKARTDSPSSVSFRALLEEMGIRQIYAGMGDVLFIAFLITLTALCLLTRCARSLGADVDIAVFCGSPILYASIFLLFWLKDAQSGVYGLQMSYKYTFFHVLAARMLTASLLGMCCNGLYALVLFLRYEADLLRLLAISFSSLVCFSVLLMAGMERGRRFQWAAVACGAWVAVNMTAFFRFPVSYGALLGRIPVYLFLGIGAAGMLLYLRQLLFLTTLLFRKEYSDAAN